MRLAGLRCFGVAASLLRDMMHRDQSRDAIVRRCRAAEDDGSGGSGGAAAGSGESLTKTFRFFSDKGTKQAAALASSGKNEKLAEEKRKKKPDVVAVEVPEPVARLADALHATTYLPPLENSASAGSPTGGSAGRWFGAGGSAAEEEAAAAGVQPEG